MEKSLSFSCFFTGTSFIIFSLSFLVSLIISQKSLFFHAKTNITFPSPGIHYTKTTFQKEKKMKDRLLKLLAIKSIVTILLTLVFCYLSLTGLITAELFMTIFVVVIGFYFGTQATKE